MKKIISLITVLALVFALSACGGNDSTAETTEAVPETTGANGGETGQQGLQVGFARETAMPEGEVHIAGGADNKISTGYLDEITVTCVAIKEAEKTVLIYTCDTVCIYDAFASAVENEISSATGVSADDIILNATHTHSAPEQQKNQEGVDSYRLKFSKACVRVATLAIEDLSPVSQISYGSAQTEHLVRVRHYLMADGSTYGNGHGDINKGIVSHHYDADEETQVIRFTRPAEDKKDIVLMNFGAHATLVSSTNMLSADFPGAARAYVEENADVHCAYFIAAAGEQIPNSKIQGEVPTERDHVAHGSKLGEYVVGVLNGDMTVSQSSALTLYRETVTANRMKEGIDDPERLRQAQEIKALSGQYGNSSDQVKAKVAEYGFDNYYHASGLVTRASAPETGTITIHAMVLGDVSFAFAPYEMFSTQGKIIKEGTPYGMTFVVTNSEYHEGYMPNEIACEHGYYEYDIANYARGTGEQLSERFVEIFKGIQDGSVAAG